jgi:3-hydroxybutyryl-CoA dehydrogenase
MQVPRIVGVLGAAGQMGSGIAEVLGQRSGCTVLRYDPVKEPEKDINVLRGAEFLIEAVPEVFETKVAVYKALEEARVWTEHVVLASNTSSLSITRLAATSKFPENFIGMHFFYPVQRMNIVEMVCGLRTSEKTVEVTESLARKMGKECARCVSDSPGFVSNRILMPYINEAIETLREGTADAKDIDRIMKLGTNVPMGPLALADFIGLDTCLNILRVLEQGLPGGSVKYRASPLLVKYVDAGWLGRKTKRGFYTYD